MFGGKRAADALRRVSGASGFLQDASSSWYIRVDSGEKRKGAVHEGLKLRESVCAIGDE